MGTAQSNTIQNKLLIFFRLLRINNWIKNLLIFFPLFFSKKFVDTNLLFNVFIGSIIFSLLSSCVYIINDIVDAPFDRNHPTKKNRPIAAKDVSIRNAIICLFAIFTIVATLYFHFLNVNELPLLIGYLLFNILYSFWLKHLLLIDVFSIGLFFEIRLFFGGQLAAVQVSHWLVLTTFFMACLIALGKRRDDLVIQEKTELNTRNSIKKYNTLFLDVMVIIVSSLLVFVYVMYSISDWAIANFGAYFYLTNFFVLLGLSKYLHSMFVDKNTGNPIILLLKDKFILVCVVSWALLLIYFIY